MENIIKAAFLGHAIGDALGVPVEFCNRSELTFNPVKDFRSFGVWNQPAGTFSDDSSMMFCTVEALCNGLSYENIARNFEKWYTNGYWGAHNELFDIGGTSRKAIINFINGNNVAEKCGLDTESSNGNGSLMRILPLAFYLANEKDINTRYKTVMNVSSITHMHPRSILSCFIFIEYCILLLKGHKKFNAYSIMQEQILTFINTSKFNQNEILFFNRILEKKIFEEKEEDIQSSGYVIHTLEASFWCFLNTETYLDAVLKAVNLGEDTDTTGAVTGGLAGLYYGISEIPTHMITNLAKANEIQGLSKKFCKSLTHE
jgi:ADP-ribosyl-[dinitrogen reductase] hydrolase